MVSYIYDGTFEGLLTLIAGTLNNNIEIQEISSTELQAFPLRSNRALV
jgi:hypothetical protein